MCRRRFLGGESSPLSRDSRSLSFFRGNDPELGLSRSLEFEIVKIPEAFNPTESVVCFQFLCAVPNWNENSVLSLTCSREGELPEGLLECFQGNIHFLWFTPAFPFPDPYLRSWRWGGEKRPATKTAGPRYTQV